MDKDIKMNLIKGLLSGRLTKKQRRGYAELESVDKELKIQWNESGNKTIDLKIKEQIWEKVKARCIDRKKDKVLSELRWYFAVASLALLLTIGGLWVNTVIVSISLFLVQRVSTIGGKLFIQGILRGRRAGCYLISKLC